MSAETVDQQTDNPTEDNQPVGQRADEKLGNAQSVSGENDTPFTPLESEVYQSVSRSSVASLILGVLGGGAFLFVPLLFLPLLAIVFAMVAMTGFRRFPEELLGRPLAKLGLSLGVLCLIGAPIYHSYIYATEVPDGYTRLDFALLKSATGQPDRPPAEALQFDEQQVFIKGYIHPSSMDRLRAKRFVLVPDLGTCCFGNQPPLTHMIEVTLKGEQYATKGYRRQRLAGTLYVNQHLKPVDELEGVFYQLRADILK